MTVNDVIKAFKNLSEDIKTNINSAMYQQMTAQAEEKNGWFEKTQTQTALINIAYLIDSFTTLNVERNALYIQSRTSNYHSPKNILIICAGNIPAVAFHDIMCVMLSLNKAVIKLSSNDNVIIPFLLKRLRSFLPELSLSFSIEGVELNDNNSTFNSNLSNIDGVIATGSNSSSLIFEQYFKNIPHIIRKSRYSVAIIKEGADISGLEDDICLYFGLGCRSISHLFVPKAYDFSLLLQKLQKYAHFAEHNKYCNNLVYQKAVMIMNNIEFIDAKSVILRQNDELYSPVGVVNYSYYDDISEVYRIIEAEKDNLQCVATEFGKCQKPLFTDYADGVNTMYFLCSI